VENTYNYALGNIQNGGGIVSGKNIKVKIQEPVPPAIEISFPNVVYDSTVTVFEKNLWKFTGSWQTISRKPRNGGNSVNVSKWSDKKGDMVEFTFDGTGISLTGTWDKEGGKADIYVDNKFDRTIDTYFNYNNQQYGTTSIWHKLNLSQGTHKVRVEIKGEKRAESAGTRINLANALVFITAPKKNESYKFSFE
jgi:hypothetical protein